MLLCFKYNISANTTHSLTNSSQLFINVINTTMPLFYGKECPVKR